MSVVFSAPSANVWCDAPWAHLESSSSEPPPDGPLPRAHSTSDAAAVLWSRLSIPTPAGANTIERVFWLDPNAVDILVDDARCGRPGTRLEVQVDPTTPAAVIARVRARFAPLQRRGIAVEVRLGRRAA